MGFSMKQAKKHAAVALALAVTVTGLNVSPVQAASAPKLSLSKKTTTAGKTVKLSVKKNGVKTVKKTVWKTSNSKVAALSAKKKTTVKVKAKKAGTAKITATVSYQKKNSKKVSKKKLTCKITVQAKKIQASAAPTYSATPGNKATQAPIVPTA